MSHYALLFDHDLTAADASTARWQWQAVDELRSEYRRPDTGERARFVPDMPGTLNGQRWGTRVYLGDGWGRRRDATQIQSHLDSGFFVSIAPDLPPPRPRTRRDDALHDIRKTLDRLERST